MIDNYIYVNGELKPSSEAELLHNNRGFTLGDGFFESMHWHDGHILFFDDHFERINKAFSMLKMVPNETPGSLLNSIASIIEMNKIEGDARVRITFYRISDGSYIPGKEKTGLYIQTSALKVKGFEFNSKGLTSGIYKEQLKTSSSVSTIKSLSSLVSVMAGIYARENKLDDVLLMNNAGNVIESFNSNLFIVKDNIIYTPPVTDGCLDGVMRKQVINAAVKNNFDVTEKSLSESDIEDADELFLTNTIQGIRWIGKIGNVNFQNEMTKLIFNQLLLNINHLKTA